MLDSVKSFGASSCIASIHPKLLPCGLQMTCKFFAPLRPKLMASGRSTAIAFAGELKVQTSRDDCCQPLRLVFCNSTKSPMDVVLVDRRWQVDGKPERDLTIMGHLR